MIKFALIRERKMPPDHRVVFSPKGLSQAARMFPEANFVVESSDIRVFKDQEYRDEGFEVTSDVSDCDVLLGVKEVPPADLIGDKKYFFFSHTIKKQPYNRKLLQEVLKKNIELFDHEVIISESGARLIGFGRYAGLVGTYNGIRMIGLRSGNFTLPKAEELPDLNAMLKALDKITMPQVRIVLSGSGKVAAGAREILDHLGIKQLSPADFLGNQDSGPLYTSVDVNDYSRRKENPDQASRQEFYSHPERYRSDFMKFAKRADFFIAGHFYGDGAPEFFTAQEAKDPDFRIKYIADISCDIAGPIASTIRPSTIEKPFYGYDPASGEEVDFRNEKAIAVMAVDNLPCELPKDASEGFGEMFTQHVLPAFFNGDQDGILDRARMTRNGKLTPRFSYLRDFVQEGKSVTES